MLLRDYSTWEVVPNTSASVLDALETMMRYEIHFWDALIIEAAERAGASILYSEALATGQRYGAILVVNPLIDPVIP
jgi:predicted nucleic acid-binding protein